MNHACKSMLRGGALLLETVVALVMGALVLVVLWGVASRFVIASPSRWTEEVAEFLIIWLTFLGAAVGFNRWEHLGLDWLAEKLDPDARRLLETLVALVCALFAGAALVYGGYVLVNETLRTNQVTPTLNVRMGYVYLAAPISGVLICATSLLRAWRVARGASPHADSPGESL